MNLEEAFKDIFPNGDVNRFVWLWNKNKDFKNPKERLSFCLWGYGEIREHEYINEKNKLLKCLKEMKE